MGTSGTLASLSLHLIAYELIDSATPFNVGAKGLLKNFNTIEEFKNVDKKALFNEFVDQV